MLLTYMSGQPKSPDFIVSTIGGIALLGVVFFPTDRGGNLRALDPRLCGPKTTPEPVSCSPTESKFGERGVAQVHMWCAIVFIGSLAVISLVFAYRAARAYHVKASVADGQKPGPRRTAWADPHFDVYVGSAVAIVLAACWDFIGWRVGSWSALYACEVVSLLAFGVAWFVNGEGIRFLLGKHHHGSIGPEEDPAPVAGGPLPGAEWTTPG